MTSSYTGEVYAHTTYLYHLGGNLTTTEAVNTYGKTGNQSNKFVTTTEGDDHILIGYKLDHCGNVVCSPWDGDFERDHEDGHAIWTLDTAGGNDYVYVRDDQNAYTVAKFGEGNDTYTIGNKLDANLWEAQHTDAARAYVFMEEGNDTVLVKGSVDGGRIFAGAGSDNITINGEVDDGGVIDLGAGKIEYANGHDEAKSVDTKDDVNTLVINCNLGEYCSYDYGKVYGGAGKDIVTVKHAIKGVSVIDVADNNDEVNVGYMQHNSKILTANDDDKVTVQGAMYDNSVIDTSGIVQEAVPGQPAVDPVPDKYIRVYDPIQDAFVTKLIKGTPGKPAVEAVEARTDDDIVYVKASMWHKSHIEVGDGLNQIVIGHDVQHHASINAGKDKDILVVHDDIEDYAKVNLGDGDNEIFIKESIEDHSQLTTGKGNDKLVVDYTVSGHSIVNLGAGNNDITIADDLEGKATIITEGGNDIVKIGDDIEYGVKLLLGEGDNIISVADHVGGCSTILTGAGKDIVEVGYSLGGHAFVNLGDGTNTVRTGDDIDDSARLKTGNGTDFVTVGEDIENYAQVDLGGNNDTLVVKSKIEDVSKVFMGDGDDTLKVEDAVLNFAKIYMGNGDDNVTITNGIYNYSVVDGDNGNDTITIGNQNGKHIHSSIANITDFENIQLVGNTELEVCLHDLIHDASDNGLFIHGTADSCVDVHNLHKQADQKVVNGETYNVYSNTHHGNEHYVYIQQDVHVI